MQPRLFMWRLWHGPSKYNTNRFQQIHCLGCVACVEATQFGIVMQAQLSADRGQIPSVRFRRIHDPILSLQPCSGSHDGTYRHRRRSTKHRVLFQDANLASQTSCLGGGKQPRSAASDDDYVEFHFARCQCHSSSLLMKYFILICWRGGCCWNQASFFVRTALSAGSNKK